MLVKDEGRVLARIVRVEGLKSIPKADRLEIAVVGGWECVVQKGSFAIGDLGLYFEIDAAIPLDEPVFEGFDTQYLRKTNDQHTGKEYAVIKTIRLRGALSQGLLLPKKNWETVVMHGIEGTDLTQRLHVLKYVSPAEAKLFYAETEGPPVDASNTKKLIWRLRAWLMKGIIVDGLQPFPHGHVKSEEQRVQNVSALFNQWVNEDADVEASIKLDGESATFYTDLTTKQIGAAQRNYSLRTTDVPYTRKEQLRVYLSDWVRFIARRLSGGACRFPTWKTKYHADSVPLVQYFHRENIDIRLKLFNEVNTLDFCKDKVVALQGEMVGPDFNGNAEGLSHNRFYVYRAYGNGNMRFTPEQTKLICEALGLDYIPLVSPSMKLPTDMKELLKLADGPGFFDRQRKREGIVIKHHGTAESVKVISNKWLEKEAA